MAARALGKRVALIIGNSAYRHTPPLANPGNDAADLAATLRALGFEVTEGRDLDKASMDRAIRDFAATLSGSKAALFFYAGHGLQVGGQNYLVPVDAQLTTAAALDFEMVRLDLVQRTMERETTTNVLILDACRDNPLARNLARALGTRSTQIGRGLAASESGEGTLISFSTQPGNVALDGTGRNSPFAQSLLKHVSKSGEDLSSILVSVRNDVMKATDRRQVPWEHSALTSKFYFTVPQPAGPTYDQQIEMAFWASVKDSTSPDVLLSYLQRYPEGAFSALAKALLTQTLRQAEADQAAREERRRRDEQALKAQQLKQMEEERKAREAALFEERRRAEEARNVDEAERLREQQQSELIARTEELRKLSNELQTARAAAAQAEDQRRAAMSEAAKAAQAAKAALAKQQVLEAGARPMTHIETQAGGRFTVEHAQKLRALVAKSQMILPDFKIEIPAQDVPADLRRFVGIWVDDYGKNGANRKIVLIVTRVASNGDADGFQLFGPPGSKSWDTLPASTNRFAGKITDGLLRFGNASGSRNYKIGIGKKKGELTYLSTNTKTSQLSHRTLLQFWVLDPSQ